MLELEVRALVVLLPTIGISVSPPPLVEDNPEIQKLIGTSIVQQRNSINSLAVFLRNALANDHAMIFDLHHEKHVYSIIFDDGKAACIKPVEAKLVTFAEYKLHVGRLALGSVNHEARVLVKNTDLEKLGYKNVAIVLLVVNNKITPQQIAGTLDLGNDPVAVNQWITTISTVS